jgi:hypothetical protein
VKIKIYKPVFGLLLATILLFGLHKLLFGIIGINTENFRISIGALYIFFSLCSIVIILLLILISKNSFDNVGMSFLIITTMKMVVSYILVRPILIADQIDPVEKINFFVMFILFLAMETVFTIRILNNKQ